MMDIGQRVKSARERAGLSLRELARRIEDADRVDGLSHTAIHKIEAGHRQVASHELSELADQLGATVSFLLGRTERSSALRLAARATATVSDEEMSSIAARAAQLLEASDLLDRVDGPPRRRVERTAISIPHRGSPRTQGKQLALSARCQLGLGTGPVGDLASLVESWFATLVSIEPLDSHHHGFAIVGGEDSVVLVNANDTYGRQRFTLAHELCHLLLVDVDTWDVVGQTTSRDDRETRADAFAAHFLAPDDGLTAAIAGRARDETVVAELVHDFGMSLAATLNRLIDLRAITASERDRFTALGLRRISVTADRNEHHISANALRYATRPPRTLLDRALGAYTSGLLGLGIVADVLGEHDLAELRRRLADEGIEPEALDGPGDDSCLA